MKRFIFTLFLSLCLTVFAGQPLKTNTATEIMVDLLDTSGDPVESLTTIGDLHVRLFTIAYNASTVTMAAEINPTADGGSVNDLVHEADGMWTFELAAANINFVGRLNISISDPDNDDFVTWSKSFEVLAANVFDALFGGDKLQVDQVELGSSTQSTTDLKDFADAGYNPATDKVTGVLLTDTTTASTDAETAIGNLNDFDPTSDDVAKVTLVATTTASTDAETAIGNLNDFDPANDDVAVVTLVTTTTNSTNAETAIGNLNDFDPANDDVAIVTSVTTTTTNSDMITAATVEGECIDALESFKLDELMAEAVTTNLNTAVHDNSVIGYMLASSDVALYVRTEDSLEDLRDRGDAAWDTATGFAVASDVTTAHSTTDALVNGIDDNAWDDGTRTLTALDEDSTTIDIDGSAVGSVTASVTTDAASRTASKADVSALATSAALSTHDGKLDTVDNLLDTEIADIIDKLKAIMSKAYSIVTAVGTFDPATDALEAQQENPQAPPIID